MDEGTCRSCGARIIWVTMAATGKKNPLDAKPNPAGNVTAIENGQGIVLKGESLAQAKADGMTLYLSHFATCPNSLSHRKPK